MCGLFAYIGRSPNITKLREIAIKAGQRGPHSCGWVWYDDAWMRHVNRYMGNTGVNVDKLPQSRLIIGHSRLATSGDYKSLDEAQPLVESKISLAHNGVVRINGGRIPKCTTSNDSEVLLRIAAGYEPIAEGVWMVFRRLAANTPCVMIATDGEHLVAIRHALPLFMEEDRHGSYLCSLHFGRAVPLPENAVLSWSLRDDLRIVHV